MALTYCLKRCIVTGIQPEMTVLANGENRNSEIFLLVGSNSILPHNGRNEDGTSESCRFSYPFISHCPRILYQYLRCQQSPCRDYGNSVYFYQTIRIFNNLPAKKIQDDIPELKCMPGTPADSDRHRQQVLLSAENY